MFSKEHLQALARESDWNSRVHAFGNVLLISKRNEIYHRYILLHDLELILQRLDRAINLNESLSGSFIEAFIDLAVEHLTDTHQKVSLAALAVLSAILSSSSFVPQSKGRLGVTLTALFNRLIDRRPNIGDQANAVLNAVRVTFDPVDIITAM